jgi:hypothetical protein
MGDPPVLRVRIFMEDHPSYPPIGRTKMITAEQAFLPYAIARDVRTLYEHVQTHPNRLLGSGE